MLYFFIKIIILLTIIIFIYHLFSKKEIGILEILILLFIFNINLYLDNNILYNLFLSIIVLLIYYLYKKLYSLKINKNLINDNKVLINRGIINFHELIKENYSYESLILNLKKRGINSPDLVDYCIKNGNDLIIFRKNTIKNYPITIIIDGFILKDNLFSINKSIDWLNNKLKENNLNLSNINYAYYKNLEIYFITN